MAFVNRIAEYEEGSPETSGGDMSFEEDNEVVLNGDVKPAISFMDEEEGDFNNEASPDSSSSLIPVNRNQCPHCFAQFSLEKNYVEHMWRAHGSRRPFRCDDCGIFLSYRSSLYNHRKIHSDKRPFACTDCSAKFRWNNSLKYHMNRAHQKAMAHITNPEKKIRQKRSVLRCDPPPAVPVSDRVSISSTPSSTRTVDCTALHDVGGPVLHNVGGPALHDLGGVNSTFSNNNLISLLMASTNQQPAQINTTTNHNQSNDFNAFINQQEINNADNSLTAMAVASTMVEQLRQVVQAMSSASDPLPGDPAHKDASASSNTPIKQEPSSTPIRTANRAATIEEVVSSLILNNSANAKESTYTSPTSPMHWGNGGGLSIGGNDVASAEANHTEHLSRICTQQEALMRRLDSFELLMQSRMKKTETLLHALLAAVSASQLQTNSGH